MEVLKHEGMRISKYVLKIPCVTECVQTSSQKPFKIVIWLMIII